MGFSKFQYGQERFPSVSMAECERPFLQLPYAQIVTVVPVVSQRTVHGGITVIGTFPYDGNRTRKLEVHIGVIDPARSSVHRLTEYDASCFLENPGKPGIQSRLVYQSMQQMGYFFSEL